MESEKYICGKQDNLLGKYLVEKRIVDNDTLDKAIKLQQHGNDNRALGTILSRAFKIDVEEIDCAACEIFEHLSANIIKKNLHEAIADDKALQDKGVNCDSLNKIIEKVCVDILKTEIMETRTVLKIDDQFMPDISDRGLNRIEGDINVEIFFQNIESTASFTCKYAYITDESEVRIYTSDLLFHIRDNLLKVYKEFVQLRLDSLANSKGK